MTVLASSRIILQPYCNPPLSVHSPTRKTPASTAPGAPTTHLWLRALYRKAVSSSNPFHAYLTFWKVWEEAEYVRQGRGARLRIPDTRVREEVFPDLFAFGSKPEELEDPSQHPGGQPENMLRGETFSKAKMVLRASYRVALAHAGKVDAGKPLTGASHADYQKVASKVPVVRYVANVVLENVRATFDADRAREAAEAEGGGSKDSAEGLAT